MKYVRIRNLSRGDVEPLVARYCASFFCRLRGLTFRAALHPGEGLLLVQQRSSRIDAAIHMLGVFMSLGIVWINAEGIVVDSRLALPWRPVYLPQQAARYVLEIAPERLPDFRKGELLALEETVVV